MELLTIKELLETGVHFGHRIRKWNPKMQDYIFTQRKGIHIIDLEKTIRLFEEAYLFLRDQVAQGKNAIFVGTKRQVQETVAQEAERCGALYVNHRWLGGTLTNFNTIRARIQRMEKLEEMSASGAFEHMPNKEVVRYKRELAKLQRNLGGLRNMTKLPGVMFVLDTQVEVNAIHEAHLSGIPVVALVDTNCDPDLIDFPIPGNDDAIKATKLITTRMADAVLEGREGASAPTTQAKPPATPSPDEVEETVSVNGNGPASSQVPEEAPPTAMEVVAPTEEAAPVSKEEAEDEEKAEEAHETGGAAAAEPEPDAEPDAEDGVPENSEV